MTQNTVSKWSTQDHPCNTISNLKELLENRIDALETLTKERFIAQQKALELASKEFDTKYSYLVNEVERLRKANDERIGSLNVYTFIIPLAVSVGVLLVAYFFKI